MRLTTLVNGARSRLLACLLTLVFVVAPMSGVHASNGAGNDTDVEVVDTGDSPVLTGEPSPDGTDYLDGDDNDGNPIDVDYLGALELFLAALRTIR